MKTQLIRSILLSGLVIMLFSGFFSGNEDIYFQISKNIDLFGKIYKEISVNYVDEINPEEFMKAGIQGMLESLDPYTIYIDENKKDEIDLITNGKYGGIGISIGVRGGKVTVVEVFDGYSAQRQGIRIGDILLEAGGTDITPKNVDDLSNLVKGDPGTSVKIKVLRNDDKDTLLFNLIREEVIVKNLAYYGFYPENSGNVYLKLSSFSRSAGDEIRLALKELKGKRKIESVILDLRGNPGGLLDVAVDICAKFLQPNQLVVSTKGRDPASEKKYYASQEPMVGNAKLVVLVNEGSASASEIVAGAIQDHDRGVILGNKTFGKGLVQTITQLNYNTSLKITTAKYYTPSGRCIQKIDYSSQNEIISGDSIVSSPFYTENKREVFSAGGITPDTIVNYRTEGDLTKDLLAKGIFFNFADYYYYKNTGTEIRSVKDDVLLNEFEAYLKEKEYVYKSEAEKQLDKLISQVKPNGKEENLKAELKNIKKQFEELGNSELIIYRKEILKEIRTELATRYLGGEGKIKEMLIYDSQFQSALNIVSQNLVYSGLLKSL